MQSKARIAGHPIHPMLVGFPVTLYVVALASFVAYAAGAEPFWFRVGVYSNLGGVVLAAIAAIPGFIDWAFAIPAGTPAKSTGLAHLVCNVGALLLFGLNIILQWPHRADALPPFGLSVLLPAVGIVLTVIAGFLGWKLVQTHHVGVELTPEQERYEPHPRVQDEGRTTTTSHGVTR
jgi:uncharacterized membrane protein